MSVRRPLPCIEVTGSYRAAAAPRTGPDLLICLVGGILLGRLLSVCLQSFVVLRGDAGMRRREVHHLDAVELGHLARVHVRPSWSM